MTTLSVSRVHGAQGPCFKGMFWFNYFVQISVVIRCSKLYEQGKTITPPCDCKTSVHLYACDTFSSGGGEHGFVPHVYLLYPPACVSQSQLSWHRSANHVPSSRTPFPLVHGIRASSRCRCAPFLFIRRRTTSSDLPPMPHARRLRNKRSFWERAFGPTLHNDRMIWPYTTLHGPTLHNDNVYKNVDHMNIIICYNTCIYNVYKSAYYNI